jgi:hypothetical protein
VGEAGATFTGGGDRFGADVRLAVQTSTTRYQEERTVFGPFRKSKRTWLTPQGLPAAPRFVLLDATLPPPRPAEEAAFFSPKTNMATQAWPWQLRGGLLPQWFSLSPALGPYAR